MTKDEIQMVRHSLLDSEWCGFSKIKTVHALCDLALKGLTITRPEASFASPAVGWKLVPETPTPHQIAMAIGAIGMARLCSDEYQAIYAAMLQGAPLPPSPQGSAEEPLFKNAVTGRQLADDGSIIPACVVLATLEFYKKHPNGIPQEIVLAMIEELIWIRTAPKKEPPSCPECGHGNRLNGELVHGPSCSRRPQLRQSKEK